MFVEVTGKKLIGGTFLGPLIGGGGGGGGLYSFIIIVIVFIHIYHHFITATESW